MYGSATGTKLKSNASNTGNSGSSNENLCYEYKFAVAITNLGGKEGQRQLWRERHRELRVAQDRSPLAAGNKGA